jgi:hypothetical protein
MRSIFLFSQHLPASLKPSVGLAGVVEEGLGAIGMYVNNSNG